MSERLYYRTNNKERFLPFTRSGIMRVCKLNSDSLLSVTDKRIIPPILSESTKTDRLTTDRQSSKLLSRVYLILHSDAFSLLLF